MQYQGVIQKVFEKPFGNKVFFSFSLSGQDGFFGTGTRKPPSEGSSVSFEADTNAKGFLEVDTKTIQYKTDGNPVKADVAKAAPKSAEEKGFWTRKEEREVKKDVQRELGASRNTAIAIIDLMIRHEAIPLPKTTAKREEFLWEILDKFANRLMGKDSAEKKTVEARAEADPTKVDEDWK